MAVDSTVARALPPKRRRLPKKRHVVAIVSMLTLSGCALAPSTGPSAKWTIDANAAALGREAGRTAATGESVDAEQKVRQAAIRFGLTGSDVIRFKEIFWEQYQRGYYGAGPYRMMTGGGGDGGL